MKLVHIYDIILVLDRGIAFRIIFKTQQVIFIRKKMFEIPMMYYYISERSYPSEDVTYKKSDNFLHRLAKIYKSNLTLNDVSYFI